MEVSPVWLRIKGTAANKPINMKIMVFIKTRKIPLLAAASDFSKFFSPSPCESSTLKPTPVPAARAIIKFCIGKAKVTDVSAFSESLATKMLSTTL